MAIWRSYFSKGQRPKCAFIWATSRDEGLNVFPSVLKQGLKARAFLQPSPGQSWSCEYTFITDQSSHPSMRRFFRWKSNVSASSGAEVSGQGPSIPSPLANPLILSHTGIAVKEHARAQVRAYCHAGAAHVICFVYWVESSIAWRGHGNNFINDQSTHSVMYWIWNEVYMRGPKAEVFVRQGPIYTPHAVQEWREAARLWPRLKPHRGLEAN